MGGAQQGVSKWSKAPLYAFNQDPEILSRLLQDGRASLSVLAKDMGEDAYRQKAWRRLKDLEEATIWGYSAAVDSRRIGWTDYIVFVRVKQTSVENVEAIRKQVRELVGNQNIRLQSLQATAEPDMPWVGRIAARTMLAARRAIQSVVEAAPDAFDGEPRLVEAIGTIVQSGHMNPDQEFIGHLAKEWIA